MTSKTTRRNKVTNWKDFKKRILAMGLEIRLNGHYKVYDNNRYVFTFPASASDPRGIRNAVTQLRARGYDVEA